MNIGIFTDCYTPTKNGVVTSIVHLKEGLELRGHKVIIFTVDSPQYEETDPSIYRFPSIPFNATIQIRIGIVHQRFINRVVQQERLDILHTHTEFTLGLAAKRTARRLKLPLVHTAHTMYEDYRHYLFFGKLISAKVIRRLLNWFLCNYDVVVCPSKKMQRYFTSFLPAIKTVVIGNGVSQKRFQPWRLTQKEKSHIRNTFGMNSSDQIMVYVGRIAQEKRIVELLNALTPFLQKNPQYKAVFTGNGPAYTKMLHTAEKHNVRQQVIFTGYVDWEHIHTIYSIADIFVTASLSENHPMTLIEASMCGLPIVARRDESYNGLIEDGYNGYLTDSDQELAVRASHILKSPKQWQTFSQSALRISEKFTTEIHVEKIEALYRQVLRNSSIPSRSFV
jgi:1,2-diacylglycerol 3-alpha-glucosyltransferase